MWKIMFNRKGDKVVLEGDNPIYYLCERFFTDESYREFSKIPIDEIVSMDTMLFPVEKRFLLSEEDSLTEPIPTNKQVLRVKFIDDNFDQSDEDVADFDFCGYDLVDEFEISAITNCGGFDETYTYHDLNSIGLIPTLTSARKIQIDLKKNNPNEEHADCLLFGIWRRK